MKLRILFGGLSLLLLVFAPTSQAQFWGDSYSAITYNMALPLSDTKDFTNAYSWRGMGMEFRKFSKPNLSYGLSLGWNVLHEEVNGTGQILQGNSNLGGAATGNQDRTINAFPLMIGFQFYGGEEGGTRPYFGISGPGFYFEQRLDVGVFSFQDNGWNWGVAPEIGFLMPVGSSDSNLLLNVRYNYAFEGYDRGPYSYVGINVGFAWASY
jgi:outer membrane protein W